MPLILIAETNPGSAQWIDSAIVGLLGTAQTLGVDPGGVNPAPVFVPATSRASGTATVGSAPLGGGETLTIGGGTLTPAGGARTPGGDDYDNTIGTIAGLVDEIIQALNDPSNSFNGEIIAFRGAGAGDIEISSDQPGLSGNGVNLSALGPGITVSGATLTGGGAVTPKTIVFEAPASDILLKQLFFFAASDEDATADRFLVITSISVDGGDNLVTGELPVSVVDARTPASSPEWNISVPAGSVVMVAVESLQPNVAVVPTWTAVEAPSTLPVQREALGTLSSVVAPAASAAEATITVLGAPLPVAGDVLYFDTFSGERLVLTAQSGAVTPGDQFFDISSGAPATIAANIRDAISSATAFGNNTLSATVAGGVVTVSAGGGDFSNAAFSVTAVSSGLTTSAFSGGADSSVSVVFPAAASDIVLEQLFLLALAGEGQVATDTLEISAISIDGGPNLIEGSISAAMVATTSLGISPRLDSPIASGQVVTVEVENSSSAAISLLGSWIARPQ